MSYKDLQVWEKSMNLVARIYEITEDFPQNELYGLTSQIRRAAISVPSNIAEGNGRGHSKEFIQYLYLARGSLMELITLIEISYRLGFLKEETNNELKEKCKSINMMLYKLIKSLKDKE
ncbi:MAG: four helix bundle protein [Kosmotogaceae bacterium]